MIKGRAFEYEQKENAVIFGWLVGCGLKAQGPREAQAEPKKKKIRYAFRNTNKTKMHFLSRFVRHSYFAN